MAKIQQIFLNVMSFAKKTEFFAFKVLTTSNLITWTLRKLIGWRRSFLIHEYSPKTPEFLKFRRFVVKYYVTLKQ